MGKKQKTAAADEIVTETGPRTGDTLESTPGGGKTEGHSNKDSSREEETSLGADILNIDGRTFTIGETMTIAGREVVVETVKSLKSSSASGVAAGTYLVVSEIVLGRKAYRAVVEGNLFPIRQYGTAAEVISKVREPHTPAVPSDAGTAQKSNGKQITLSDAARNVVELVLRYRPDADAADMVSRAVVEVLGPEGERLRKAHEALVKLPPDILDLLAVANDEKRAELTAVLHSR